MALARAACGECSTMASENPGLPIFPGAVFQDVTRLAVQGFAYGLQGIKAYGFGFALPEYN